MLAQWRATVAEIKGLAGWLLLVTVFGSGGNFLLIQAIVQLFMENGGFSHALATTIYGIYGVLATLVAMAAAPPLEALPVRPMAITGLVFGALMRLVLAGAAFFPSSSSGLVMVTTFLLTSIGDVMWITPITLALHRCTLVTASGVTRVDARARPGTGTSARVFALAYSAQNVAAAGTALLYEGLRDTLSQVTMANGLALVAAATLQILAVVAIVPAMPALQEQETQRLLEDAVEKEEEDEVTESGELVGPAPPPPTWWELVREMRFWAFVGMCILLIGVRMIFRHLDTTLPVVMKRLMGERAHFPLIQAINPLCIIPLAPLIQWALAEHASYVVIAAGTTISALSVSAVVAAPTMLLAYIVFIAVFSVGEALWSARFTTYALSVAPKGREATYNALAAIPTLLAKLPSALFSAWLVSHYCPDGGGGGVECDASSLWAWVMGVAAVTPAGLWLAYAVVNNWHRVGFGCEKSNTNKTHIVV